VLLTVLHLLDRRILFFGGKGGVGKTTCAAAVALGAARRGRHVLLVSTDPAHSTSDIFEVPFSAEEREVAPGLTGLEIDGEHEAARYLDGVKGQIAKMFSPRVLRQAERQIELAGSMPGVADVALFDRLADLVVSRAARYDLLVFDTAPTGHTLRLLQMPELMATWIGALVTRREAVVRSTRDPGAGDPPSDPILEALERRRARLVDMRAILSERDRTGFVFVLLPERLAIEETARAIHTLRDAHLDVTGLIVNRVLPEEATGSFVESRRVQERVYREEIDRRFAAFPRVTIPQLEADVHGIKDLARIGALLLA
jgi:arsenite-transporting ATPase